MKAVVCFFLVSWATVAFAGNDIPKTAWSRPIGLPLENPGVVKDGKDIDDGYWQGVPVGGLGAGTFSRSYRGDFSRWHIKGGVHKYEPVYANQFAMFQQSEGDARGVSAGAAERAASERRTVQLAMGLPGGRGRIRCALFPKAWFDYQWKNFPLT